jgi:hypothetical protein
VAVVVAVLAMVVVVLAVAAVVELLWVGFM